MRTPALILLGCGALACAQQTFEIHGTVIDPGTNHALEGVEVTVIPGNGLVGPGIETTSLQTDSQGEFRFTTEKGGQYVVRVRKEGYDRTAASLGGGASDQHSAVLSAENPAADFQFELQPPREITGRIVDDDTGAPLDGVRFGLAVYVSRDGKPSARGRSLTTDADGRFQVQMPSGAYLVLSQPQTVGQDQILAPFTAEDAAATDLDYRYAYFPGGPEVEHALPIQVPAGGAANFGTIRVRKQKLYRVQVNLDPASCPDGAQLKVTHTDIQFQMIRPLQPVPCGPFLVTHVAPGSYELLLRTGTAPDSPSAVVHYTVTEANLELPAVLSEGTTLTGTVVADRDEELPLSDFKVSFGPVNGFALAAEVQPHDVDTQGHITFLNLQPGSRRRVEVSGLGNGYYVKEVRYRDQPAPGGIIDIASAGELAIVIGRGPAAISGTVTNRDKPVPGADVVVLRWPPDTPPDDRQAVRHVKANAQGQFQLSKMVPGEYRIFAVTAADSTGAQLPGPWQRLLMSANKLTLDPATAPEMTLEVSDPAR